jgi:hypothetical protein
LSCGVILGVIVARNWKRRARASDPVPPEILQRRVALLEEQLNTEIGDEDASPDPYDLQMMALLGEG